MPTGRKKKKIRIGGRDLLAGLVEEESAALEERVVAEKRAHQSGFRGGLSFGFLLSPHLIEKKRRGEIVDAALSATSEGKRSIASTRGGEVYLQIGPGRKRIIWGSLLRTPGVKQRLINSKDPVSSSRSEGDLKRLYSGEVRLLRQFVLIGVEEKENLSHNKKERGAFQSFMTRTNSPP